MNSITVNGVRIEADCLSGVTIANGEVWVGGRRVSEGLTGIVEVKWEGPAADVTVKNAALTVKGDVAGSADAGGPISCGNVGGDVDAGGSVNCGAVQGDVDVGGRVDAGGSVMRG